jgi:hypothetical protein
MWRVETSGQNLSKLSNNEQKSNISFYNILRDGREKNVPQDTF